MAYIYSKKYVEKMEEYLNKHQHEMFIFDNDCYDVLLKKIPFKFWSESIKFIKTYSCGCTEDMSFDQVSCTPYDTKYEFKIKYDARDMDYVLYAILHIDDICFNCYETKKVLEYMAPEDTLLQNAYYSHGLSTGYGRKRISSMEDVKDRINGIFTAANNNSPICASWKTQPIGTFGVYVGGKITLASNKDLWSKINKHGDRVFDAYDSDLSEYIFQKIEDLDLTVWDHTEFWVIPEKIGGFWIKESFANSHPEFVKELQKYLHGTKLYYVRDRRDRK